MARKAHDTVSESPVADESATVSAGSPTVTIESALATGLGDDVFSIEAQGVTRDIRTLPYTSLVALAQKGFRHVLGNEAASKVTTWKAKVLKESGTAPQDDEIEAVAQSFEDALLAHIDAGTMGRQAASGVVRSGKLSPFDRHMRALATADVRKMLADMNVKVVKGVAQFADSTRDLADMVTKRIAADSDPSHRLHNTLAPRAKVLADAEAAQAAMATAPESAGLDF